MTASTMSFRVAGTAALIAVSLLLASAPGRAETPKPLCAAAGAALRTDARLSQAATAVFGAATFASDPDASCTYPLKILTYRDADVLLTQDGVPDEGCHGCAAHLSAHVLGRVGSGFRLLKSFPGFADEGSAGQAGDISGLNIGADDGLAAEGGGTFQGSTAVRLDLFVFRAGSLIHLAPDPPIYLVGDNTGSMTDESKAVSVQGIWSLDPHSRTELDVHYVIKAHGQRRTETVTWSLQGSRLVLTKGKLPPELKEAGAGE